MVQRETGQGGLRMAEYVSFVAQSWAVCAAKQGLEAEGRSTNMAAKLV
jgi:hypothetical protein